MSDVAGSARQQHRVTVEGRIRRRQGQAAQSLEAFANGRRSRFPKEYADLLDIPPEQRDPLQTQIAAMVQKQVQSSDDEVAKAMKPEVKKQWQELGKEMAEFAHLKPPSPPTAITLTDVGPAEPATVPAALGTRLRFKLGDNNALANYLSLYSGNAGAANRPQWVIQYVP